MAHADLAASLGMDRSRIREMGFVPLPQWRDALRRYLIALKERGML